MDDRLKRVKEIVAELSDENKMLSEQKGKLSIENFELKKRVAELEDTLAKVLNSADKNVVRCKDCKYCKIEDWDKNNCRVCTRDRYIRSDFWFCSGGVRKE